MATPVFKNILPAGSSNRPGTKLPGAGQLFIVVHETGNPNRGADAESQIAYLQTAEAKQRDVSYHLSVDDHRIWQGLPLDEIGFHAGDGCDDPTGDIGCFRSIAIEGCINVDGNETQMRRNYAELIARLAKGDPAFDWGNGTTRNRFSINLIKQHIQVSTPGPQQHHCPDNMLKQGFWPTFMRWVDEASAKLDGNGPDPTRPTNFPAPRIFHAHPGALLRQKPTRDSAVVKSLQPGVAVKSKGFVLGQIIDGDERWLKTTDSPMAFLHAGGAVEPI